MKRRQTILTTLTTLLLILISSSYSRALSRVAIPEPVEQIQQEYAIDPIDTMDEDDYVLAHDTMVMSRVNVARQERKTTNAMDYVLDDRYRRANETFISNNSFFDHVYVGIGLGMDQIVPMASNYRIKTITQGTVYIGKDIDKFHSLRLALGYGYGYQEEKEYWLMRGSMRLDYLYNLSTHFVGYNPSRMINVSFVAGLGGNFSKMKNKESKMSAELRFGTQLKFFAGIRGYFNIEPYIGLSSDQIDVSENENWHKYDLLYGINMNYVYYLKDHLSPQSKSRLLRSRLVDQRMVNDSTLETWRSPWFFEAATGIAMSSSALSDMGMTSSLGTETSLRVGRWLSPIIGLRASIVSRSTKWRDDYVEATTTRAGYNASFQSHYLSGRVEALFNPFGFFKNFSWDAKYGGYLAGGMEWGYLTKWQPKKFIRVRSEAYTIAAHLFMQLTPDVQAFIEPRYTKNIYIIPYTNVDWKKRFTENAFAIETGLTMLVRSEKFHELDVMDDVQNFMHSKIRGIRVGVAGGLSPLEYRGPSYGGGITTNLQAFAEFRFTHLHSVRAVAMLMNFNRNAESKYYDSYVNAEGEAITNTQRTGIWNYKHKLLLASLDYEVSLTNLCSGRLLKRDFELEAFAGPTVGFVLDSKATLDANEPLRVDHSVRLANTGEKKMLIGMNGGLKLTKEIWKGFSGFFMPTLYYMQYGDANQLPGVTTIGHGKWHLYQTLDLGVQYKIGSLHRDPNTVRKIKARKDRTWSDKQRERENKDDIKQKKREEKRMEEFNKRHEQRVKNYYKRHPEAIK